MTLTQQDAQETLSRFGLSAFRSGQREVIDAVLAGEDSVCIMPTGGGKSLCYQLPAVMRPGVALVVSPLIALMKDQVDALLRLGLRAACINSALNPSEQAQRIAQMQNGELDLLYIAPERFRSPRFVEALRRTNIQLLAIDEAHCISEWGHDFRPDYARLGWIRKQIGAPVTIALTATATPTVRDDIITQLGLRSPRAFMAGFSRPNLQFEVQSTRSAKDKGEILRKFLDQTPGSGIVYTSARKRCQEVAELISQTGRSVGVYHAGLQPDERKKAQERFMRGQTEIVVATVAFGMGIDKADVRFVVHYNMPGSIEGYYQEAGRAGRDGDPSRCLLIYTASDRYVQEYFIDNAYPPRDVIKRVYEFLCQLSDDPIERTQLDIKDELNLEIGGEGVGACLQLLNKAGAIERLEPLQNRALVRLNSEAAPLVDLLPPTAKVQRKVLAGLDRIVGDRRFEDVYFHPRKLAEWVELDLPAVTRALRELRKLEAVDYVPPFRGRALRVAHPRRDFDQLPIDFEAYEQRKQAEYAKLDEMIAYATGRGCRQLQILRYFGDEDGQPCGNCDRCGRGEAATGNARATGQFDPVHAKLVQTVRIALSGVARTEGRVGKQMIAQMLAGSSASKVAKMRLNELSTFGLLKHLRQSDIVELLEAMQHCGLVEQYENQRYRPILRLTEFGQDVMRMRQDVPAGLQVSDAIREAIGRHDYAIGGEASTGSGAVAPQPSEHRATTDDSQHSTASNLPEPDSPTAIARVDGSHKTSRPSYHWTWRLLSAGFRMDECCEIRRLSMETIVQEAMEAMDDGLKLDARWLFSADELAQLETSDLQSVAEFESRAQASDDIGLASARWRLYFKCRQQTERKRG